MQIENAVADAGGLSGSYTSMTVDRALAILRKHYGLSGTLKRFDTEKDDTFRLTTPDNRQFVLKVSNPSESKSEIEFQNGILKQVEVKDPSLAVPRVLANIEGEYMFDILDVDGQERTVRLLTYLEGTPLCETSSSPSERVEIGKVLARLRYATEGFTHPAEDRMLAWNVQNLRTLEHLLVEVDDRAKRKNLSAGMERFREVEVILRNCRQQVLHNDFSKSNIVVDHNDPSFVKGIIDFGDSVKTAIAVDVSTALLNQLPQNPAKDLFQQGRDIMTGYLSIAELTEQEILLIPHLVMGRVVARALLSLWRAKLFPENQTYILRNTEQGWHQLEWFLAHSPDQISETLIEFTASPERHPS